ncbi:MAG TPA: nucleoside-diphosphate kinase [Streptosporangiaceae bacterium]|nr:nucleoside-diphosphate kinase [Streptosporangiaceae bacterium]
MQERTLVIVKPDAYQRGLTGVILARLEQRQLVVEAIRVSRNEKGIIEDHYPRSAEWLEIVGSKTLEDYARLGVSAKERLGTDSAVEIGQMVRNWLTQFLLSAPVVPMVVSGNRAIETVRKIIGATLPVAAAPGTIRGDFSSDSPDLANSEQRPVMNLVHASGDPEEAAREIALWFPELP